MPRRTKTKIKAHPKMTNKREIIQNKVFRSKIHHRKL